ncbi:DNA polymerase III subunit delta' [Candidatus Parcubacteria bacterium]|nr:DNA polymerase III subunit delta' [Candidatus Parcubacteria bacterium]
MTMAGYQKQWEFLKKTVELEKVSHAYLFLGQESLEKKALAVEFIKLLNCQAQAFSNRPCQSCRSCKDIEKEIHPDFNVISPEAGGLARNATRSVASGEIQIFQIRELKKALSLHPHSARYKSVIIEDAEKMNQEAASALLKTLEEPRGSTVLILISRSSEALLPTIVSRCQIVKFYSLGPQKLSEKDERIKKIISLTKSDLAVRFQYAKELSEEKENIKEVLNAWLIYFRNLLLSIVNENSLSAIHTPPSNNYSLAKLNKIIKTIERTNLLISSTNVNPKLALEILMLEL